MKAEIDGITRSTETLEGWSLWIVNLGLEEKEDK